MSSEDLEEPVTPSHLFVGRRLLSVPDLSSHNEDPTFSATFTSNDLTRRMNHLGSLLAALENSILVRVEKQSSLHEGSKRSICNQR